MRAKVYENNSYLPALIYVLFTSSHPALFTLSPALMGLTLVLLGLGNMLRHVEFRAKKDIQIIMIGLYFGMSSLFYFPYIVFIPISVMLLLIFTSTIGRRYFLLVFGGVFLSVGKVSDHTGASQGLFIDQFDQIQQVLRTYRDLFCYFWQAGDASRVRAWLFTPH